MVIFVRICEIFGMSNKYLFSPDMIGGTLYYACDYNYVPWLEKSQGMCNVVWNVSHLFALPPQMGSLCPFGRLRSCNK